MSTFDRQKDTPVFSDDSCPRIIVRNLEADLCMLVKAEDVRECVAWPEDKPVTPGLSVWAPLRLGWQAMRFAGRCSSDKYAVMNATGDLNFFTKSELRLPMDAPPSSATLRKWDEQTSSLKLVQLFEAISIDPKTRVDEILAKVDTDGDGFVSEEEFLKMVLLKPELGLTETAARDVFRMVDENSDNQLSKDEINKFLSHFEETLPKESDVDIKNLRISPAV